MAANEEDCDAEIYEEMDEELCALNAMTDPVLTELWDNEEDAEYDRI
jgi:hypothetical protein